MELSTWMASIRGGSIRTILWLAIRRLSTGLVDVANGGRVQANSVTIGESGNGTLNISSGGRVEGTLADIGEQPWRHGDGDDRRRQFDLVEFWRPGRRHLREPVR